jgi:hypothetical protein
MSKHLQKELLITGNGRAIAERFARLTGTDIPTAEAALTRFRTGDYDGALAATSARAKQLQAQDAALRARRQTANPEKWTPAAPATDANGRVTEQFAGLGLEGVASDTRTIAEALRIWSAESGTQHGDVTMLGLTIHASEQVLNTNISPFELLNQVDQAVSMGADRIGHALIMGIEPDVLVAKGRLQPDQKAAFAARQREVTFVLRPSKKARTWIRQTRLSRSECRSFAALLQISSVACVCRTDHGY